MSGKRRGSGVGIVLIAVAVLAIAVIGILNGRAIMSRLSGTGYVAGIVCDEATGEGIANVLVVSGGGAALTQSQGEYCITVKRGSAVLCFSANGYRTQEKETFVKVGQTTWLSIGLEADVVPDEPEPTAVLPADSAPVATNTPHPTKSPAATHRPTECPAVTVATPDVSYGGVPTGRHGLPIVSTESELETLCLWMLENGQEDIELDGYALSKAQTDEAFAEIGPFVSGITWSDISLSVKPRTPASVYDVDGELLWKAYTMGRPALLTDTERSVLEQAQQIVSTETNAGMTDYEKELALHEYVTHHCDYLIDLSQGTGTCGGLFLNGVAQCSGYADAFALLGRLAGLEVECHSGTSIETGESHEWNTVRLNGKWYMVDCTWDDPTPEGSSDGRGYHAERLHYFNVPIPMTLQERIWDDMPEGAQATELDEMNWYVHNGMAATNQPEAERIVSEQISSTGRAYLLYSGAELDRSRIRDVCFGLRSGTLWESQEAYGEDITVLSYAFEQA